MKVAWGRRGLPGTQQALHAYAAWNKQVHMARQVTVPCHMLTSRSTAGACCARLRMECPMLVVRQAQPHTYVWKDDYAWLTAC